MANEEVGRFVELAALDVTPCFLNVADLIERFLELAGEARAVEAERTQPRDEWLQPEIAARRHWQEGTKS